MRITTCNVNGIRAAVRKGMREWLDAADVDVLTLQEVRAEASDLAAALPHPGGGIERLGHGRAPGLRRAG